MTESIRPERRTEFSPRYKAGQWAARIDTQDRVAPILAVEALAGNVELVPKAILQHGGRIAFEAREDFEVRWDGGRQFVSVKDRQVSRAHVKQAIEGLALFAGELPTRETVSLRIEAASASTDARSLYEDIRRLRSIVASGISSESDHARTEFAKEHGVSAQYAEHVVLIERRIGEEPVQAEALFAHAMRSAVTVHNYGDTELVALYENLSRSVFYDRRRVRGVLDLGDLERILLAPLVPLHMASYQGAYVRTRWGYMKDPARSDAVRREGTVVAKCAQKLMREWRRKTFWDRTRDSLYRGYIGCLACDHPMIANYNGRNGLACPSCGYQPFITLFYACDCGEPIVVQRQPDLSSLELFRDAIRIFHDSRLVCSTCNAVATNEKFISRMFALPIPFPVIKYPTREIVRWREALGWSGHGRFSDPSKSPDVKLLATMDDEPESYLPEKDEG